MHHEAHENLKALQLKIIKDFNTQLDQNLPALYLFFRSKGLSVPTKLSEKDIGTQNFKGALEFLKIQEGVVFTESKDISDILTSMLEKILKSFIGELHDRGSISLSIDRIYYELSQALSQDENMRQNNSLL